MKVKVFFGFWFAKISPVSQHNKEQKLEIVREKRDKIEWTKQIKSFYLRTILTNKNRTLILSEFYWYFNDFAPIIICLGSSKVKDCLVN